MENRRIFQDGMDLDPADFNSLQDFVQDGMEHVVSDAVTSERKYANFLTSITGTAEITVQPGRLYSAGSVYARDAEFVKDFTTALPISGKKNVLVVVYGQEVETNATPREFLINEETNESAPRTVAIDRTRQCIINTAAGSESPDPIDPIVDAGTLAVARIVLGSVGVLSVEMLTDNKLDSISSVSGRLDTVETFVAEAKPQIVALGSDIASLKVGASGNTQRGVYERMLARLAVLEEKSGIPSAATDSDADFLLDTDESDLLHASFLAKVSEGARFADEAIAEAALAIFDPLNPKVKITGGVMLPAYTRDARLSVGPRQSEIQVSAYSYQSNEIVQRTMARTRVRYGEEFTVCTNTAWWQSGQYDYDSRTFRKDGEVFNITNETVQLGAHDLVRAQRFWFDTYEENYWENVTVEHTVPGAQIAESFLNSNDMWLDAVGLTFTRLAATGGFTLSICELGANGTPDLKKVISHTEVERSAMLLNTETVIPIQPCFLEGGKRYALVIVAAANHYLATTQGTNFTQGTLFYVLDGAYQQGDGTRDLCFTLYAAKFAQARAVVELNALSLSGGIASLDILAPSIVPDSTGLTYEVQVGGVWTPIGKTDVSILGAGGSLPPLVPLRAVFVGTPDVMPAITLTGSRVRVSRPRTAFTHISTERTLPTSSSSIRVVARLEYFDAAHHTAVGKIRTGAGFTTVVTASSTVSKTLEDGSIERTWLFNLGSPVSAYKIQIEGTTDAVLRSWHVGWRKDYAL